MVVQGANDPRVNKRNSDEIVIAVRDRGVPVEYLVAPDEGHFFAVSDRVKEIAVDPKTVKLAAAVSLRKLDCPFRTAASCREFLISRRLNVGGQTLNIASTSEVKDQAPSRITSCWTR
jgi:hypothetical protein